MAQLLERLLPTPEVCELNPVIGKLLILNCTEKTKIKKKRPRMGRLKTPFESRGIFHKNLQINE